MRGRRLDPGSIPNPLPLELGPLSEGIPLCIESQAREFLHRYQADNESGTYFARVPRFRLPTPWGWSWGLCIEYRFDRTREFLQRKQVNSQSAEVELILLVCLRLRLRWISHTHKWLH